MRKPLTLSLLSLLLTGCVGGAVVYPSYEFPDLPVPVEDPEHAEARQPYHASRDEVIKSQGRKPDAIEKEGDTEIYVYQQSGHVYGGLMPFIILPIPLLLPVGHEQLRYEFGDKATSITQYTTGKPKGGGCGLFILTGRRESFLVTGCHTFL